MIEKELWMQLRNSEPMTVSIQELIDSDLTFYIPAYQRGYRWEKSEILRLIEDIRHFDFSKDGDFYCLQPVVVQYDEKNDLWRLVDGQQRLTTIYLLLSCLDQEPFALKYQREDADGMKSRIEQYYVDNAKKIINEWKNAHPDKTSDIVSGLKKDCKVIWYRLPQASTEAQTYQEEHEFFLHLNSGKIALTDAELVKASLLHHVKKEANEDKATFERKQMHRAAQWDSMERALREKKFWRFIAGRRTLKASSLDYLLEIIYFKHNQSEDSFNNTQNPIFSWLESNNLTFHNVDELWDEMWKTFHRLEGWFNDATIYNLIGVLATRRDLPELTSKRIVKALKKWDEKGQTKSKFIDWLWKEAAKDLITANDIKIAKALSTLDIVQYAKRFDDERSTIPTYYNFRYDNSYNKVFDFLLLANIMLLNPERTQRKFAFEEFNSSKNVWNIEHISPNNPKNNDALLKELIRMRDGIKKKSDKNPLKDTSSWDEMPDAVKKDFAEIIKILSSIDVSDGNEARDFPPNPTKEQEEQIRKVDDFKANYLPIEDDEVMTLGNLTLLTERPNKGISNNFFLNKRMRLAKYQSEGCFIPPLTLNVFTKWYTNDYDQPLFWRKKNRMEYLRALDNLVLSFSSRLIEQHHESEAIS